MKSENKWNQTKESNWIANTLKGLWVGSTMTVPGVSGGTMAVVVGIYEDLIRAINRLKNEPKVYMIFLLQFALGAVVGFLVFARMITALLESAATSSLTKLFFCGVVVGGIPLLVRKSEIDKIKGKHIVCLLVGAAVVLAMTMLPTGLFVVGSGITFWILQFVAGVIIAIALILPGISVTHILYIMGLYEVVLQKVYALQFVSLIPLVVGLFVGTFLTADLLEKGMECYPQEIYMAIIGFVAGSLVQLIPRTQMEMPAMGILIAIIGFVGMYGLTRKMG
ncbi:MAG: DUF368 domain-containing protein [Lachnospiraceae bacterium]|nr:DUF368 domain-containing protein [Lachnospiraceae bacterium]